MLTILLILTWCAAVGVCVAGHRSARVVRATAATRWLSGQAC